MCKQLMRTLSIFAAALLISSTSFGQDPPDIPKEYDVATRGPVHEAFAQPIDLKPEAGPAVPKAPPAPVEELPPEQQPEGNDIEWIPGYWAWDGEENNFLWVSGFWRDAPPGRKWIPGTWQEAEDGWHWTPGFWAPEESETVNYVPPPPETLEAGPTTAAPSETHNWIPGYWVWRDTRFFWRPGFWCAYQSNWVWCPPRYCWTPAGCVFIDGYWDHPYHLRGVLFAPVRFHSTALVAGFHYSPYYSIRSDFLMTSLFVGPARRHYYFGDYFHDNYQRAGFTAWIDFQPVRGVYDPSYSYYRTAYRGHPEWTQNLNSVYRGRYNGDIARPPTTLVQQQKVINNITNKNVNVTKNVNITNVQNVTVVEPVTRINNTEITALSSLATTKKGTADSPTPARQLKMRDLQKEQRSSIVQNVEESRRMEKHRRDTEAKLLEDGGVTPKRMAASAPRLELPRSKVVKDPAPKGKSPAARSKAPESPRVPQEIERDPPKEVKPPPVIRPPARKKEKDDPPPMKKVDPLPKGKGGFPLPPTKEVIPPKKDNPPPKVAPPPKKDNPPPKAPPPKKKKDDDIAS